MSDDKIHIIGGGKPQVANLGLMGATDAELLTELERRGVDLIDVVFRLIQFTSAERNARWSSGNGGFSIMERGAELCEEAGEASGNAKKIRRLELGMGGNRKGKTIDELRADLEYELGDVLVTAANLANKGDVSLANGLRRAFNERSASMGFPERL